MFAFPSHGAGILDHGLDRIQQGPIPVMLQNPPTPLDRVLFTVIWRIRRQTYREVRALGKLHEAVHELGPSALALGTIVQIDDQGCDVSKALFDALPLVDQTIH